MSAMLALRQGHSLRRIIQREMGMSCRICSEFHTTGSSAAGQNWRAAKGLPKNPNAYGPLTDGPDYSFIDGRPTPPGTGKIKRAVKHLELSEQIMTLAKEVDFAVENHKQRTEEEELRKKNILDRKLLPKGQQDL